MTLSFVTCLVAVLALVVSAEQPTVCSPSQCLTGATNITLATTLSSVFLLPGTYSSTSPVALILPSLASISAKTLDGLTVSPETLSYPFTVSLSSGALAFESVHYAGSPTPINLSSNLSSPRLPASIAIPPNMAVTFRSASSSSSVVLFGSSPDTAQLPSLPVDLAFAAVQATSCAPACASGGACTVNGTCACAPGFAGSQCEQCAPGHFGPTCQQCPDACCDEGMTGTGRCLGARNKSSIQTCGCDKGSCGSDGVCSCNAGWADAPAGQNATKCSVCAAGFFLDSSGNCQVCSQGCSSCAATTGVCTTCKTGFTTDNNDRTRCVPTTSSTSCPDGQFLEIATGTCSACSPLCKTCTGPLSTQCVACGAGQFTGPGGQCVAVDSQGVCQGSKLVANNAKGICDACPSTCTSCSIPSFSVVSTTAQIKCSACLPGFVLTSDGKCASTCPAGTFVSPSDGFTCTACDGSCAECAGSSTFCTACATGGALDGKCVSTCPGGTFLAQSNTPPASNSTTTRGSTCLACHGDCATCSGASNTQCSSCSALRPVKSQDGRCLPASSCGAQSFFDTASGSCARCDGTCASCLGAGNGMCSACPDGNVLQAGKCVAVQCSTTLGLCLSNFVSAPSAAASNNRVAALQIALGATGGLSLLVLALIVWRRRARAKRAQATAAFADTLPDTKTRRWDWGTVWRLGEAQRKHERGAFGLGCGGRRRKELHREMSLRKLGSRNGPTRTPARTSANMSADRDWRTESSVVFNRNVPIPPFSDRDSLESRREEFWRDSVDEGKAGAFGGINPESHFAKTLAAVRAGAGTPPVARKNTPTPVAAAQSVKSVTPDVTGVSAHTFGVSPSPLVSLSDSPPNLVQMQTGTSTISSGTSMDMHGGGRWMVPDFTGMSSVPTNYTGMSGSIGIQHTGASTSTLASHYTGMSAAPRAPLSYAPFLSSSTATTLPQPRQPLRDNSDPTPFAVNTARVPQQTNFLMSPPPQGVPSSPVWPGAVGGSYWFSEAQQQQTGNQQTRMGDKNPFRRF